MSRRTKLILLFVGGFILIGVIVWFFITQTRAPAAPATGNANTNAPAGTLPGTAGNIGGTSVPITNSQVPTPSKLSSEALNRSAVQKLSVSFAERLGSYSNQGPLSNLEALKPIVTPEVFTYLNGDYRAEIQKSLPPRDNYYGINTVVVNTEVVLNEDAALVTIHVQRAETGTVQKTSYATLSVQAAKTGDSWLVSYFKWQ